MWRRAVYDGHRDAVPMYARRRYLGEHEVHWTYLRENAERFTAHDAAAMILAISPVEAELFAYGSEDADE